MLDADVVIHLRDGTSWIEDQVGKLSPPFFISAISRVELENGAARTLGALNEAALAHVLSYVTTVDFGSNEIAEYRRIVRQSGYSRRKTSDWMTAATALAHGLALVTLNGRDFGDVAGLDLIAWELPA